MSKLQILIPQYNEDNNKIKPLLDSIAIQQDINLKEDIEVFIGNDGSDTKLTIDFLKQYPFRIQYHYFEHGRLAATRQKLFELVTAPYVMWCDADDKFINTIALSMILSIADTNCDAIICDFFEQHLFINKPAIYLPYTNDSVFVHGKIYRTEFLRENHIEWHPELHEHQDSPFNVLARTCSANTKILHVPIYLWCDNPDSISRKDGKYHSLNTWPHMIDSYQALVDDLKDRGYGKEACYYAKYCLYATYYEMSHAVWKEDKVAEQKINTYKRLSEFYKKNELLIKRCSEELTEKLNEMNKKIGERRGKLEEMPPFDEWLKSVITIWRV